jgi:hypothetical protein
VQPTRPAHGYGDHTESQRIVPTNDLIAQGSLDVFEHVKRHIGNAPMLGMTDLALSVAKERAQHTNGLHKHCKNEFRA